MTHIRSGENYSRDLGSEDRRRGFLQLQFRQKHWKNVGPAKSLMRRVKFVLLTGAFSSSILAFYRRQPGASHHFLQGQFALWEGFYKYVHSRCAWLLRLKYSLWRRGQWSKVLKEELEALSCQVGRWILIRDIPRAPVFNTQVPACISWT